jgi:hypothetical protein
MEGHMIAPLYGVEIAVSRGCAVALMKVTFGDPGPAITVFIIG